MGLSVEIAERMADVNLPDASKTPAYDLMMAKKQAAIRVASGKRVPVAAVVGTKADPMIGRRFRDAWGQEYRITRTEPGHVWARAGMLGAEKRYLRSKVRPCLIP